MMTCILTLAECGCGGSASSTGLARVGIATTAANLGSLAVLGDSISAGAIVGGTYARDYSVAWPTLFATLTGRAVTNLAVVGQEEPDTALLVPQVPSNASFVVYAGGTDDVFKSGGPTSRIDDIVGKIQAQAPSAKIVFLTVRIWSQIDPASLALIQAWNAHERAVAASIGGIVVDDESWGYSDTSAYPDGTHPSFTQAQFLAQAVAAALH